MKGKNHYFLLIKRKGNKLIKNAIIFCSIIIMYIEIKYIDKIENRLLKERRKNNLLDYWVNTIRKPSAFMKPKFMPFMKELPIYNHTHKISNKIFWCWLQGLEQAPKLAKACLNSIRKNCYHHDINIISNNNIKNFTNFPSYILKKYKMGYISKTHFSDLLRLEVLINNGGTWTDASILVTKYNKDFFYKDLFFFQSYNKSWIAGSSWFITSEKGSPILRTTLDLLYEYWRKNNALYNYFLFHIFFKFACNKYLKDYMNIKFYSNEAPHILQWDLFHLFRGKRYEAILANISVHKLTLQKKPKKKGSIYHRIIKEYIK